MSRGVRKLIGFAVGTAAAWAFAVKPRVWGKPDLREIRRYDYARRGYRGPEDVPENSLAGFQEAMDHGYGITMDVRLTADGVPVVFHDEYLYRMTGNSGRLEDHTLEELQELRLHGGEEKIPTLDEALALVNGQVPVILELRPCDETIAYLCESICRVIDEYDGIFAVQAMDPRILRWFREERNEYIRSQMVDYNYSSGPTWRARVWDLFCNSLFLNCITEPDLISCSLSTRYNPSVWICRILYRVPQLTWTVTSMEEYEYVRMDGEIAVFTDIEP